LRTATAGTGKGLSLELGGKSPFIVFADADLDSVVEGVVDAIWFNQGQVCCAGSRLLVQEGVADRLIAKLKARMERLRVGSPLDKAVDMGAIVAPVQLERIRELVAQGVQKGAHCWQPAWAEPADGWFHPPTLFTNVEPAATIAQVEIFGPVLVTHTFRTPDEAVQVANNTPYGLAASVWSDDINVALDIAPRLKCGVVWVNSTNLFDAAAGFGGYRESGFGREGGREGMWEYVKPLRARAAEAPIVSAAAAEPVNESAGIDRTPKLYVGGKQARPDSGYSLPVFAPDGRRLGEVGEGNRKDIRNAVEAAHAASAWARSTGHARAQVLYYLAENLSARAEEFAARLAALTGRDRDAGRAEVEASLSRLFTYAAWADKFDGAVHRRAAARRRAGHARTDRGGGRGLPPLPSAARPRVARRAAGGHGQHRGGRAERAVAIGGHRPLQRARHLGRAGRRGQHRDRARRRARARAGRARRCGCGVVRGEPDGRRRRGAGVDRQPQAHLDRMDAARLVRPPGGGGAGVPAPGRAGEEHLDSVRRVTLS
jgi:aldehyde dehydrogenase (NAD+)